jgi:hypothetical protein
MGRCGPSFLTLPLLAPLEEIQRFLEDFCHLKGVNIIACQAALEASALLPDVLPHVPVVQLTELNGLQEGHVIKLQIFGKQWVASLEEAHLRNGST